MQLFLLSLFSLSYDKNTLVSTHFPISAVHVLFKLRARDHENRNDEFEISTKSEMDVY